MNDYNLVKSLLNEYIATNELPSDIHTRVTYSWNSFVISLSWTENGLNRIKCFTGPTSDILNCYEKELLPFLKVITLPVH